MLKVKNRNPVFGKTATEEYLSFMQVYKANSCLFARIGIDSSEIPWLKEPAFKSMSAQLEC